MSFESIKVLKYQFFYYIIMKKCAKEMGRCRK